MHILDFQLEIDETKKNGSVNVLTEYSNKNVVFKKNHSNL